jgi:hypothetical protein
MGDFLRNPLWFPAGRSPKLNTAHPFYSKNWTNQWIGVAGNGGMRDLVSGTLYSNSACNQSFDENGPYVCSTSGSSTGQLSISGPNSGANFMTMGMIFKHISSSNREYLMTVDTNSGFFINGNTLSFLISNGAIDSFTATVGHTYFVVFADGPATSDLIKIMFALDMTTGQIFQFGGVAVAGNQSSNAITHFTASSGISLDRVYASFVTGSGSLTPGSGNYNTMGPTWYTQADLLKAAQNPWSLWYA